MHRTALIRRTATRCRRDREGERLAFATDTAYPVITGGNPKTVDIAVVAIGVGETAHVVAGRLLPRNGPSKARSRAAA